MQGYYGHDILSTISFVRLSDGVLNRKGNVWLIYGNSLVKEWDPTCYSRGLGPSQIIILSTANKTISRAKP